MGRNIGKNISKNLSSKYSQKLFDHTKQSATDTSKTSSKRVIQKNRNKQINTQRKIYTSRIKPKIMNDLRLKENLI